MLVASTRNCVAVHSRGWAASGFEEFFDRLLALARRERAPIRSIGHSSLSMPRLFTRVFAFYWGEGIADDVPALTYYLSLIHI